MNKVFFGECILVSIRIRIHHEIAIRAACIGRCPEEVLSCLGVIQFGRYPDIAAKQTIYLIWDKVVVLFLQQSNLTVHFSASEEVDNRLLVFFDKLLKHFFVRSLNGQYHLWRSINVFRILESTFGINIFYIYYHNITDQLQRRIIVLRWSIHNPERRFRLGQSRHVRIKHIMQGPSGGTVPHSRIYYNQQFIRTTARGMIPLQSTRSNYEGYQSHA